MSGGKGIHHMTIRNTGTYDVILEDAQEVLMPNDVFVIESNIGIMNDAFPIRFNEHQEGDEPKKECVMRYIVEYEKFQ